MVIKSKKKVPLIIKLERLTVGQIVDKTIMEADLDRDGKISFEEFTKMVETTDVSMSMTLGK